MHNEMREELEKILREKEDIERTKKILKIKEEELTKKYYGIHKMPNSEGIVGTALVFGNDILDNARNNEDKLTRLPKTLKLEKIYTLMGSLCNGETHTVSDLKQIYKKRELNIEVIALEVYKPGGIENAVRTLTESGEGLIIFSGFNSKNYTDNYYDMHKIAKELAEKGKISECYNKGRLEKVYTPIGKIICTTKQAPFKAGTSTESIL